MMPEIPGFGVLMVFIMFTMRHESMNKGIPAPITMTSKSFLVFESFMISLVDLQILLCRSEVWIFFPLSASWHGCVETKVAISYQRKTNVRPT